MSGRAVAFPVDGGAVLRFKKAAARGKGDHAGEKASLKNLSSIRVIDVAITKGTHAPPIHVKNQFSLQRLKFVVG